MRNQKYFPFERNHYYFGKLLTAKDFEAEQRYFNDKRRFANRLQGANGIVAGLGVVMADDTSIILQAGCAYDASGREIVAPETKVVKLSTIEGYNELTGACAYLGIRYEEQSADEVYSAMNESGDPTFNKVREGYQLSLLDESFVAKIPKPAEQFVTALTVYSDSDITVTQHIPAVIPRASDITIRVELKKSGPGQGEYSFGYALEAPGFLTPDGDGILEVSMGSRVLSRGECASVSYTLSPKPHLWGGGEVTATISDLTIRKNDESFSLNDQLTSKLKPVEMELTDYYIREYYQKSMDKVLQESYDDKLWIAKIDLFRQGSSVIIDKVFPAPFGQYSYNAQQLMLLRELETYYPGLAGPSVRAEEQQQAFPLRESRPEPSDLAKQTACGVFDLGLGLGYSTKEPVFSEEIMHGLGKGPVYVEAAVEYISSDPVRGTDSSEIILGDVRLFASEGSLHEEERIYNVSLAVKVLPERGTFVVAALPKETSGLISLRIRWFAMRLTEVSKQIRSGHDGERYILINPDTIVLPPKGTAHVSPVFINMPTEACNFKLIDPDGGSIDNNGVYTAPAKEGVYEIRVEAISDPAVYTHAFAIVTQKKKSES